MYGCRYPARADLSDHCGHRPERAGRGPARGRCRLCLPPLAFVKMETLMRRILLTSLVGVFALAGCDASGARSGNPPGVDLNELGGQAAARVGVPQPGDVPLSATVLSGTVVADGSAS